MTAAASTTGTPGKKEKAEKGGKKGKKGKDETVTNGDASPEAGNGDKSLKRHSAPEPVCRNYSIVKIYKDSSKYLL